MPGNKLFSLFFPKKGNDPKFDPEVALSNIKKELYESYNSGEDAAIRCFNEYIYMIKTQETKGEYKQTLEKLLADAIDKRYTKLIDLIAEEHTRVNTDELGNKRLSKHESPYPEKPF